MLNPSSPTLQLQPLIHNLWDMAPRPLYNTHFARQSPQTPNKRHIRDLQQPKRFTDSLEIAALGLGHVEDADGDGEEGGTAEEKVDARGGAGEEHRGDEGDEEICDLLVVSWGIRWGGDMGGGGTYAVGALAKTGCAGAGGGGLDFGGEEFHADCPGCWNERISDG